ncbi:MAG TPA: hypothetical protein VGK00_10300 [Anaerolineales bacterium]|jgi:hypothetical protein
MDDEVVIDGRTPSAPTQEQSPEAGENQGGSQTRPYADEVTRYKGALDKYLAAEKKDLPKHITSLLEKLDPADQIEYLAANREELGKQKGPEGVPPSPKPSDKTLSDDEKEAARRGQGQLYSSF